METVLTIIAIIASVAWSIGIMRIWLARRAQKADRAVSAPPLPAWPPGRRVRIVDLLLPGAPVISGRTFEGVHFIGPAFIKFLDHNRIEFGAVPDRRAILPLAEGSAIFGAVLISNCTFLRCYFDGISILGTIEDIEQIGPGFDPMTVERWEDGGNVGALGNFVAAGAWLARGPT